MFHHHHLCNSTDRQNMTFKSSPLPWARPIDARVPMWCIGSVLRTQRDSHRATEQPSLAHPPHLQPHLVLISSLTRGWLSISAGSHLSPLECIRIFRKQVVSDVRPGREKDYPRFPTPPPPFTGFDGKAVSISAPPIYTPSRLTSPQSRQMVFLY